jgi:hypothetical protein
VIGSISQDGGQLLAQEALLRKKRHLISQLAGQKTHTLVQGTQMCPLLWLKHECYYQKSILQVRNLPPLPQISRQEEYLLTLCHGE